MAEPIDLTRSSAPAVFVAVFDCPGRLAVVVLLWLNFFTKRAIMRARPGDVLAAGGIARFAERRFYSFSVWSGVDGMASVSSIHSHRMAMWAASILGTSVESSVYRPAGSFLSAWMDEVGVAIEPPG